jgi:hypothetical protein
LAKDKSRQAQKKAIYIYTYAVYVKGNGHRGRENAQKG